MCRLFGFRSEISLPVQHALIAAENALVVQSQQHPHGWGIAYFEAERLEIHKGISPAFLDLDYGALCASLTSHTVIAHVRQATVGGTALQNTHPFRFQDWVFAHNGTVFGFQQLRPFLLEEIAPRYHPLIQGETDSEHCFYLFLTRLEMLCELDRAEIGDVEEALATCLQSIASWCRLLGIQQAPCMNFMLTNGQIFAASRLGRELFYSAQALDGDAYACEEGETVRRSSRYREGRRVRHLLVASERISDRERWQECPNNSILLLDRSLHLNIRLDVANLESLEFAPMPESMHGGSIAN